MKGAILFHALCAAIVVAAVPTFAEDGAYEVVKEWPKLPAEWTFGEGAGVAVDSHNHVFIFHRAEKNPVICVKGETGEVVHAFGDGLFKNAHGVAIDNEDNVWLVDNGHHQIFKFTHDGELLLTVGEQGVTGWDATHFNSPTDVVVTPTGEFYVSDGYVNSRVAKFSAEGKFLFEWGSKGTEPGQFRLPHGIAQDKEGLIYVADRTNQRIQVFDPKGKFIRQWGSKQLGEKGRPWGLEIAQDGYLYVIDGGDLRLSPPQTAQLLRMDLRGNVLDRWSSYGEAPGLLAWGHDVTVGRDGAVYVAEVRINLRSQKFVRK